MRLWLAGFVLAGAMTLGPTSRAAPRLEIERSAAHVVIIPQARPDILVKFARSNTDLPLRVRRDHDVTYVEGAVGHRVRGCPMLSSGLGVRVRGLGNVEARELPSLVIFTPMRIRIVAGDAVSGEIGRSAGVDFENRGCGRWVIADIGGPLRLSQIGAGEVRTGSANSADLNVAGGGDVETRGVRGSVTAVSSGEGEVAVDAMNGELVARVAGSGGVEVRSGQATRVNASVAGSGSVRFGGVAGSVAASVAGPGRIVVARAHGPISKRVFGAGQIEVGR